ncbi:MAG TPA: hypothetical protein VHQ41_03460 [Patescibacteria group bacterium]|jgi:hypothetical protein|nr:hypothetical protein [Patescibacteria group bacterium]
MELDFIKKIEATLNKNPTVALLLSDWAKKGELETDSVFVAKIVVRKSNNRKQQRRYFDAEALTDEEWETIFALAGWTQQEKMILENFRQAQKYDNLWIGIDSILSGFEGKSASPQTWWTLMGTIGRKLQDKGSPMKIRSRKTGWGFFKTFHK